MPKNSYGHLDLIFESKHRQWHSNFFSAKHYLNQWADSQQTHWIYQDIPKIVLVVPIFNLYEQILSFNSMVNVLKFCRTKCLTNCIYIANSVDPDQTAPAVWSGSTLPFH